MVSNRYSHINVLLDQPDVVVGFTAAHALRKFITTMTFENTLDAFVAAVPELVRIYIRGLFGGLFGLLRLLGLSLVTYQYIYI